MPLIVKGAGIVTGLNHVRWVLQNRVKKIYAGSKSESNGYNPFLTNLHCDVPNRGMTTTVSRYCECSSSNPVHLHKVLEFERERLAFIG